MFVYGVSGKKTNSIETALFFPELRFELMFEQDKNYTRVIDVLWDRLAIFAFL